MGRALLIAAFDFSSAGIFKSRDDGKWLRKPRRSLVLLFGFPLCRAEQLDSMWGSRRALFESHGRARCVCPVQVELRSRHIEAGSAGIPAE